MTNWATFQLVSLNVRASGDRETGKAFLSVRSLNSTGLVGACCSLWKGGRYRISPRFPVHTDRSEPLAPHPLPSTSRPALSKSTVRNADAGGSNGGAELRDNVANGDGGKRGGIGLVIGLHRVVRTGPGPQFV